MAKKVNLTPSRTCADCFHFSACHLWAVSISTDVAPQCPQFEPARYASIADLHEMYQMSKGEPVPVVRCRECRHFVKYDDDYRDEYRCDGYCKKIAYIMDGYYRGAENRNADDFCSHGEKMGGGAEG